MGNTRAFTVQRDLSMAPPKGFWVKCRKAGTTLLRKVFFRPLTSWAGKMIQQLKVLATVTEDLGSILSTWLTNVCNSDPRTSEGLF